MSVRKDGMSVWKDGTSVWKEVAAADNVSRSAHSVSRSAHNVSRSAHSVSRSVADRERRQPRSLGGSVDGAVAAATEDGLAVQDGSARLQDDPLAALRDFPPASRVWVFGADRELDDAELEVLLAAVDGFLPQWAAHGVPLRSDRAWLNGRFLVVAADVEAALPSGCSIDALVRVIQGVEARIGARLLGSAAVWHRDREGRVRHGTRANFRALGRAGAVAADTIVFDTSVTALGDVMDGRWEGPAGERWHAALLR